MNRYSQTIILIALLLHATVSLQLKQHTSSHWQANSLHFEQKQTQKIDQQQKQEKTTITQNTITQRQISKDEAFGKKVGLKKKGNHFIGKRTTTGEQYKIEVLGGDDLTFFQKASNNEFEVDSEQYDVIIVGSGLAGMTSSLYITDKQKKVLILQKEKHFGGLSAFKKDERGFCYDRGAAYWTKAYNEQFQVMSHVGISQYFGEYIIPEPIDSFLWNGTLYGGFPHEGLWDERTLGIEVQAKYKNGTRLPVLPSCFAIFKLQNKNDDSGFNLIPDQPFELWPKKELDTISAAQWVRNMPKKFHQRISKPGLFAKERRLWARFQKQIAMGVLDKNDPMKDVINFLDTYSRSALGTNTDQVSAMAFSNFYVSELEPRFSTPYGNGIAIKTILDKLKKIPHLAHMKTETPVVGIKNVEGGVQVKYLENGKVRVAKGKVSVYAAQLTFAPNIIEGLDEEAPLQAQTFRNLTMAHYSVHTVEVTGHPFRVAYDTWVRSADYTMKDFTDVIIGRWTELKGYSKGPLDQEREMMLDFTKNPDNKGSVFAIYHALHTLNSSVRDKSNQEYGDYYSAYQAELAFNRLQQVLEDARLLGQQFKMKSTVTNRWPYSIHIAEPGHFNQKVPIMRASFKNIVFGNNNLGTPSFQQALFRGHCAANQALYKLEPKSFKQQSWSKCKYKV